MGMCELFADTQQAVFQVDIVPCQRQQLTLPEAGTEQDVQRHIHIVFGGRHGRHPLLLVFCQRPALILSPVPDDGDAFHRTGADQAVWVYCRPEYNAELLPVLGLGKRLQIPAADGRLQVKVCNGMHRLFGDVSERLHRIGVVLFGYV